jgi:hypothetical protein
MAAHRSRQRSRGADAPPGETVPTTRVALGYGPPVQEPLPAGAEVRERRSSIASSRRLSFAILVVAAAGVAGFIFWTTRDLAFFLDDWNFIATRPNGFANLLDPYNDHWQALPILAYQVALAIHGLDAYPWLVVVAAACHSAAALGLFLALHRVRPWLALTAALALLTFTWSDEVFILPVNISITLAVALGMLALACWDRDVPEPATDVAGAVALIAAFASGGMAIPIAVVVTGIVAARRRTIRAWLPVLVPWLAFAGWFLVFGRSSDALTAAANLHPSLLPAFVANGLATLAAPLLGLDHRYQLFGLLAVAGSLGLGLGLLRSRSPRIWLPILGAGLLYLIVGLARLAAFGVHGAEAPRYLFPALALLLLGVAPLVDGLLDRAGRNGRRILAFAVAAWLVVMLVGDADKLRRALPTYEDRSAAIETELGAVQRLRPILDVQPVSAELVFRSHFGRMTVAEYFTTLDTLRHGPAPTVDALLRQPEAARKAADALVDRLLDPAILPGTDPKGGAPGFDTTSTFGQARDLRLAATQGACRTYEVTGPAPTLEVRGLHGRAIVLRTDGQRTLRLFTRILASRFGAAVHSILPEPDRWYRIALPALSGGLDWSIRLDPPPGSHRFDACVESPTGGS